MPTLAHKCPTCGKRTRNDLTVLPRYDVCTMLEDLQKRILHVDSKAQAGVITNAELSKQVAELSSDLRKTQQMMFKAMSFIIKLLDDKDANEYAKAILRHDFKLK